MQNRRNMKTRAHGALIAMAVAGTILSPAVAAIPAHAEKAVAPEKNPPGDIPDTQVFIDYTSPEGFTLKVPEGWARTDRADGASFVDKLDGVIVTVGNADAAPTPESIKADYLPAMEASVRAIKVESVKSVKMPAGPAILIVYSSNSEPNPVTNKQVRQENNRYLFFKSGKLVALDLYAPFGADNVDQWQLMSHSFRWN
ncbi:hypothetical protein [Oricola nitratireducens]|uniref:hypothetical protein n=1 Tax=Oricola nitratireducens TaxID=2775868 RepID=UPI001FEE3F28|nr:hypothetical protein [Oricola nitratireducens]